MNYFLFAKAILNELLPPGSKIHPQPRLGEKAGGVALLYKEYINVIRSHSDVYSSSFEHLECRIDNAMTRVIVLYRPPVYNEPELSFNDFIDDFSTFL